MYHLCLNHNISVELNFKSKELLKSETVVYQAKQNEFCKEKEENKEEKAEERGTTPNLGFALGTSTAVILLCCITGLLEAVQEERGNVPRPG